MSHHRTPSPILSDPGQSSGDASLDHEVLSYSRQSSSDASSDHEVPSDPGQSSSDASSDHEEYFKLKEAYLKVTDLYSSASLDVDKMRDELKAACAALGIIEQEATQACDEKATTEAKVQNLLVATYDAAFPMQRVNDPSTIPKERL